MKTKFFNCMVIICLTITMAGTAAATIITGKVTGGSTKALGGIWQEINPIPLGFMVGKNNQQSPNFFGLNEVQNILLPGALNPNVGGILAAGTKVASHYIFFDPRKKRSTLAGWVQFDAKVLGIITSRNRLNGTDGLLGNPLVTYKNPPLRGLEKRDRAWIGAGASSDKIFVRFRAGSPGDYIRVLTEESPQAVPEPATMLLFGIGITGLVGAKMRQKRIQLEA